MLDIISEKVIHGKPYINIDIKNSNEIKVKGIINNTGIFLMYLINNKKKKLKINESIITRNIITKNKYVVSLNTKNGFFNQISKLRKKLKLKLKLYIKIFDLSSFIKELSKK